MSEPDMESKVRELWDRQQILDCLHRYARGCDRLDRELILSVYHPDAIDEHGKFVGTPDEFADWVIDMHTNAHLSTQHVILNHSCELDGHEAHAETYFMFVSMNARGPKIVTIGGGRYIDRFEKRDGRWAVADRITLRDWSMMDERPDMDDLSSFTSTRALLSQIEREFMNGGRASRRDRSDPSYECPLTIDRSRREGYKRMKAELAKGGS